MHKMTDLPLNWHLLLSLIIQRSIGSLRWILNTRIFALGVKRACSSHTSYIIIAWCIFYQHYLRLEMLASLNSQGDRGASAFWICNIITIPHSFWSWLTLSLKDDWLLCADCIGQQSRLFTDKQQNHVVVLVMFCSKSKGNYIFVAL